MCVKVQWRQVPSKLARPLWTSGPSTDPVLPHRSLRGFEVEMTHRVPAGPEAASAALASHWMMTSDDAVIVCPT